MNILKKHTSWAPGVFFKYIHGLLVNPYGSWSQLSVLVHYNNDVWDRNPLQQGPRPRSVTDIYVATLLYAIMRHIPILAYQTMNLKAFSHFR